MYDVGRLLPIFVSILGSAKEYSNFEYYFFCPFCHHYHAKLAINLSKGKWHCWKCGAAGNRLLSLLRRLDVSHQQIQELRDILADEVVAYVEEESQAELRLPEGAKPLWVPSKEYEYKHALRYLAQRKVTAADIIRYGMLYCSSYGGQYSNRVIIPSYDVDGNLNFFTARDFFGNNKLKYRNPPVSKNIVGFEFHINWNYPIVLCEGPMDAIAIKWNAVPLFGKTVPKRLQQRIVEKKVKEIYIALDEDASKEALRIAQSFMKEGQKVYVVELHSKDPSELGFDEMRKAISNAHAMSFRDVIAMKLA